MKCFVVRYCCSVVVVEGNSSQRNSGGVWNVQEKFAQKKKASTKTASEFWCRRYDEGRGMQGSQIKELIILPGEERFNKLVSRHNCGTTCIRRTFP